MPHIHTDEYQHDLSVTGYIARLDGADPRVLLHKHKKYDILLPVGGHVELDETPWQAMSHELEEESGYKLEQLEVLQPPISLQELSGAALHPYPLVLNTHDLPGKHFHSDIAYGFIASSDPELNVAKGESTDLVWLTRQELVDLSPTKINDNARQIYLFLLNEAIDGWTSLPTKHFPLALTYGNQ